MSRAISSPPADPVNRRRHRRVEVAGVATVTQPDGRLTVWAVQNLSLGGASLAGDALLIPSQHLELTFYLPGQPPFVVLAHVLRRQVASRRGRTAIAFEHVTASQRDLISASLEAPAARPESASRGAIVVSRLSPAIAELMQSARLLGHDPRLVEDPLAAAAWLQKDAGPETLLVDEKLAEVKGWNLLEHLRDTRPSVRRFVIGSSAHGFRTDVALRSGLADAVVERPFTLANLARRLGPAAEATPKRRARK